MLYQKYTNNIIMLIILIIILIITTVYLLLLNITNLIIKYIAFFDIKISIIY